MKWKVYDVYGKTNKDLNELFKRNENEEIIFNTTENLNTSVNEVIQFEEGAFCLVSKSGEIEFENGLLETEAPEGLQIKSTFVEIRTFDYSYFEIYSNDLT